MAKIRKTCSECQGQNVVLDAWASWSEDAQDWVLEDRFDNAWCRDCECECTILDEEIPDPPSESEEKS